MNVSIRKATADDLAVLTRLLRDVGLPTRDLSRQKLEHFLVAVANDDIVACVGAEICANVALLRSLAVTDHMQGRAIAGRLVARLELYLLAEGIDEVWLLTTDADRYFQNLGFARKSRERAPGAIRATAEFASLCPGDAVLMRKTLGGN